jgi:catechol 2,3-dioxygenase-like lactoylglutathione lyase family enzyme
MQKRNPFGHIDLRVSSLTEALPFYEVLLPALGFVHGYHGEQWKVWGAGTNEDLPGAAYFGITESAGHVPNENRIAFWAQDAAEVDRIAALLDGAGARDVSGPKRMPYGPDYYAVFFADPCGNRFEVYHRLTG